MNTPASFVSQYRGSLIEVKTGRVGRSWKSVVCLRRPEKTSVHFDMNELQASESEAVDRGYHWGRRVTDLYLDVDE